MLTRITLLIPGMELYLKACKNAGLSLSALPALNHLLAHPHAIPSASNDEQILTRLLSLPEDQDFPAGALHKFLNTGQHNPCWYACVTPASLVADKDGLLMESARPTHALIAECYADISLAAQDCGLQMERVNDELWLLYSATPLQVKTTPLQQACGQRIETLLPTGTDAAKLRRFMSDSQMLLAVFQQKKQFAAPAAQIKDTPNTLWVWGSGALPPATTPVPAATIYSNCAPLQALGKLTATRVVPLPTSYSMCSVDTAQNSILVILDDYFSERPESPEEILNSLHVLEKNWLHPIQSAIEKNSLQTLHCYSGNGFSYEFKKRSAWMRWKKRLARLRG